MYKSSTCRRKPVLREIDVRNKQRGKLEYEILEGKRTEGILQNTILRSKFDKLQKTNKNKVEGLMIYTTRIV